MHLALSFVVLLFGLHLVKSEPRLIEDVQSYSPSLLSPSLRQFSVDLLKETAKEKEGVNILFSPLSISTAFSILSAGASGDTLHEINTALRLKENFTDNEDIHKSFEELLFSYKMSEIGRKKRDFILLMANLALLSDDFLVKSSFRKRVRDKYYATVASVNFVKDGKTIMSNINRWIKTRTNNQIEQLFREPLAPDTKLVVMNAVYFNGNWESPFDSLFNGKGIFYNNGREAQEVTMMSLERKLAYAEVPEKGIRVLEIPYRSNASFVIVLPNEKDGLREVISSLSEDDFKSMAANSNKELISLSLPKFKLEAEVDLKDKLMKMGMKRVFSPAAELTDLSDEAGLFVSNAKHKALIDVNEEGSEASGVTSIEIVPYSIRVSKDFVVNRPFLFFIRDNINDVTLFVGAVNAL